LLFNDQQMRQGTSWIYECVSDLPQHVSASGFHLQGVVGALEATQVMSVLWAFTDYDPSSVASCRICWSLYNDTTK
jgi:hypothetical protein